MRFSDIFKKGYGKPDVTDIIVGGLGIDIKDKKAYSHAEDGTIFSLGLNEEEILDMVHALAYLPPIGSIIMYAGQISNLPVNWAICNGSNGTPDLRDKFVYGTNVQSEINTTGGTADSIVVDHNHVADAHSHVGSTAEAGEHSHTYNTYTMQSPQSGDTTKCWKGDVDATTSSDGIHMHDVTVNEAITTLQNTGESGEDSNIPPYVKLAYIMRKS